jgi:hypothetical protein
MHAPYEEVPQSSSLCTSSLCKNEMPSAHFIPVYDRSSLPPRILKDISDLRERLIADYKNPDTVRFSIPMTKTLVEEIASRVWKGSGLDDLNIPPIVIHVNDASWGKPSASLIAGILRIDPEAIAIMNSEDQLAALIAHELSHHLCAHFEQLILTKEGVFELQDTGMFARVSLSDEERNARWEHEFEADTFSVFLLANAGYDPVAAIDAFLTIENEWNTEPRYEFDRQSEDPFHPPITERIENIKQVIADSQLASPKRTRRRLNAIRNELANRCRDPESSEPIRAKDLYQHYRK